MVMLIWERMTPSAQITRARRELFETPEARFWGTLGMGMPFVPVDGLGTIATDGRAIYYDPADPAKLGRDQTKTKIAHEISHPALDHFRRQKGRDHDLWNVATDHEINLELTKAGFTPIDGWLCNPRFQGMPAEQIYEICRRENEQDKSQGKPGRHQPVDDGNGNMREVMSDEDGNPMDSQATTDQHEKTAEQVAQTLGAARKAGMMAGGHVPSYLQDIKATLTAPTPMDWRQPLR